MAYDHAHLVDREASVQDHLREAVAKHRVTWLHVNGLGDEKTIKRLGELFDIHPLALEDVVNAHQRAKVEVYNSQLFIVVQMAAGTEYPETEQLSLFLGENYVLTFQDRVHDCLEPIRERIRESGGMIRDEGADHLMYAIVDAAIDSYFPILEQLGERLDALEGELDVKQSPDVTSRIHKMRNDLLFVRRAIWPHRDTINELVRDKHCFIQDDTRVYLRDCYDHTSQIIDLLEVYRDMAASLRDYYVSIVSLRSNEVMKVLTIIATLFIPLSFIAALYGMNFDTNLPGNMPELRWPYGYFIVLGLMLSVATGLIAFFYRRGWIGPFRKSP